MPQANRLCGPAPLYDVAGWASSAAMAELFGVFAGLLNDDQPAESRLAGRYLA
ncbi:MAG TPA: hypothetical protein VLZ05_15320 [Mycobacterium sp.]|nr:hypothetical protein [Mycobacterium sp.]HUH70101.1 hypothetical protein [Mycobacterium sp.]